MRLAGIAAIWLICSAQTASDPAIDEARAVRARFAEGFTLEGRGPPDAKTLEPAIAAMSALANRAGDSALGAEARLEWAELLRFLWRNDEAIPLYQRSIRSALAAGRRDLAFDAQIGLARSYGLSRNHGAALWTMLEAEELASSWRDPERTRRLAGFGSELAAERGETVTSLAFAAEELCLAREPLHRAWVWSSIAFAFDKIASGHTSRANIPAAQTAFRAARAAFAKSAEVAGGRGNAALRA